MGIREEVALTLRGALIQRRVIGALIIRELHARFGRHYYGYIWMFFEPFLLGGFIGLFHVVKDQEVRFGPFEFWAIGYILYFIFRGIIARSVTAVHSNLNLLYHRTVSLPDIFFARHLIEFISCSGVMLVFLFGIFAINGNVVEDLNKIFLALIGMTLFSQGLALVFAAIVARVEGFERIIHPFAYLMLPVGGMFFLVESLPDWLQEIVLWIPTVHLFELLRDGQFGSKFIAHYDLSYLAAWILATHLLGLSALRIARQRIGLE
jgi:capsular polysaccharide transport system permease protein